MGNLSPAHWQDYEIIDSGGHEKLERFGKYVLRRPEPQALWPKALTEAEWEKLSDAAFFRTKGKEGKLSASERGEWKTRSKIPEQWSILYDHDSLRLVFNLRLTSFGHVGIFPEQAGNWEWVCASPTPSPSPLPPPLIGEGERGRGRRGGAGGVLNLFAYTGGFSLAARAAGYDVVHVDAVRNVVNRAKENMVASHLDQIHWIVEDAFKFVQREVRRGKKYTGIILDPPAYGRGPEGEKWLLSEQIDEMVKLCSILLEPEKSFFILNLYSMGFSATIAENLVLSHFSGIRELTSGELYLPDRAGRKLPLGVFVRFQR
ncbi:MAG: oxidoreductase [Bacteroidetes bacterium]|nr:oxidoreductase [Bacteroidota bacterium]